MGHEPGGGAASGGTTRIRYVQRVVERGAVYLYFRKGDWREGPLTGADGSDELRAEVEAILARGESEALRSRPQGKTTRPKPSPVMLMSGDAIIPLRFSMASATAA